MSIYSEINRMAEWKGLMTGFLQFFISLCNPAPLRLHQRYNKKFSRFWLKALKAAAFLVRIFYGWQFIYHIGSIFSIRVIIIREFLQHFYLMFLGGKIWNDKNYSTTIYSSNFSLVSVVILHPFFISLPFIVIYAMAKRLLSNAKLTEHISGV